MRWISLPANSADSLYLCKVLLIYIRCGLFLTSGAHAPCVRGLWGVRKRHPYFQLHCRRCLAVAGIVEYPEEKTKLKRNQSTLALPCICLGLQFIVYSLHCSHGFIPHVPHCTELQHNYYFTRCRAPRRNRTVVPFPESREKEKFFLSLHHGMKITLARFFGVAPSTHPPLYGLFLSVCFQSLWVMISMPPLFLLLFMFPRNVAWSETHQSISLWQRATRKCTHLCTNMGRASFQTRLLSSSLTNCYCSQKKIDHWDTSLSCFVGGCGVDRRLFFVSSFAAHLPGQN